MVAEEDEGEGEGVESPAGEAGLLVEGEVMAGFACVVGCRKPDQS